MMLVDINKAMSVINKPQTIKTEEADEFDENLNLPDDYKSVNPTDKIKIQDIITSYIYEAESGWYIIDGIEWVYNPELVDENTGTCWRTNVKITRREWPVPGHKIKETEANIYVMVEGKNGELITKSYYDAVIENDKILGTTNKDEPVIVGKKSKSEGEKLQNVNVVGDLTKSQNKKIDKGYETTDSEYISDIENYFGISSTEKIIETNSGTIVVDPDETGILYNENGSEIVSAADMLLNKLDQYVFNSDKVKNSTIPLTGLKDFMKEIYRTISEESNNKVKLVSARRWAVNEAGEKIDGNAFIVKNGYYKCMNAIGDVLYFKSNNSRHLYGEAIDIINVDIDFTELMTSVIMKSKAILTLMYNNGVSAYIEQSTDDLGTTTKHYHIGTDTIKQKEFWASVKAVLGSDKIPGTLITFSNYMKNNIHKDIEFTRADVKETTLES
jgi:hypothetical protein